MESRKKFYRPQVEMLEGRLSPSSLSGLGAWPDDSRSQMDALSAPLAASFILGRKSAVATAALPSQSPKVSLGIVPPTEGVYGPLSAQWSQWSLTVPAAKHPLLDPTGANAAVGQSGSIWFLGGSLEGGVVTRNIKIPHGTG